MTTFIGSDTGPTSQRGPMTRFRRSPTRPADAAAAPSALAVPERQGPMRLWARSPEFGPYMRAVRERKRLSLGIAAHELGVSPTHLGRLERGDRGRPPTVDFLELAASVYSVPLEEMMVKAGFTEAVPAVGITDDDVDRRFANLFLFGRLRPPLADEAALNYYSHLQKRQILYFAERLEMYAQRNPLGRRWSVAELQMDRSQRPVPDDPGDEDDEQPEAEGGNDART